MIAATPCLACCRALGDEFRTMLDEGAQAGDDVAVENLLRLLRALRALRTVRGYGHLKAASVAPFRRARDVIVATPPFVDAERGEPVASRVRPTS